MRILFATAHKHLPELRGGMEINTHELASELAHHDVKVGVLAGLAGRGLTGRMAQVRIRLGEQAPMDRHLGYPVWRAWDPPAVAGKVCAEFQPDVVILQGGHDFFALARACRKSQARLWAYLHTQDLLEPGEDDPSGAEIGYLANSAYTASLHPRKSIAAVLVPIVRRERYATDSDRSTCVFINPAPYKGVDIVHHLAKARPDIPFLFVVNRRDARAEALADIKAQGLTNIRVSGPVRDMRRIYRHAKLVLAPSRVMESWGRMATEAHFSGIPVLASDRGGLPEAVGPGGQCVSLDEPPEAWTSALSKFWDDGAFYQAAVASARAHADRDAIRPDRIVATLLNVINDRAA